MDIHHAIKYMEKYNDEDGMNFLKKAGVKVFQIDIHSDSATNRMNDDDYK